MMSRNTMKRREKRDAKEEIKEKCENNFLNRKFIISKKCGKTRREVNNIDNI